MSGYSHRLFGPPSWIRKTVESWDDIKSLPSQWEGRRKIGEGGGERKIPSLPPPPPTFSPQFSQSPANPKWQLNTQKMKTTKTACTAGYNLHYCRDLSTFFGEVLSWFLVPSPIHRKTGILHEMLATTQFGWLLAAFPWDKSKISIALPTLYYPGFQRSSRSPAATNVLQSE